MTGEGRTLQWQKRRAMTEKTDDDGRGGVGESEDGVDDRREDYDKRAG